MDIDFRWGGDLSIVLGVEAARAHLVIRVIFQLAEEIPCISVVVVAFLYEVILRIDYTLKATGGSLTTIPGLADMTDDTMESIVTDTLEWPHRVVLPIGRIPVDTSDLELKPQGKLIVTVVKASDLKNMEMIGKSDPYVVLHVWALFKVKTMVVDDNLNPVWNETFELIAEDKETQSLTIEVLYHAFNKEEQHVVLEAEKRISEERKILEDAEVIKSTVEAIGVGRVGSGIGASLGVRVEIVGTDLGVVGNGLSKVGRLMGRTITGHSGGSKRGGSSTLVNSV
ncbi:hypothetical protein Ancab_024168 [Ancistrocladus abbreviatus]